MKLSVCSIILLTLMVVTLATCSLPERTLINNSRITETSIELGTTEDRDETLNENRLGEKDFDDVETEVKPLEDQTQMNYSLERSTPFRKKFRGEFLRKDLSGTNHLELDGEELSEELMNADNDLQESKVIFGGPYENLGSRVRREARKADKGTHARGDMDNVFRSDDKGSKEDKSTLVIIMVVLVCLLITYYYCICCVSIYYFKCQYCFDFDCYKRPGCPCPTKAERTACSC